MRELERIEFFDSLAERWDTDIDLEKIKERFRSTLKSFGIRSGDNIVDIGCGTGNLTLVLLEFISESGSICAIDFSPKMLSIAKSKLNHKSVQWICCSAERIPIPHNWADHIFCCSVWPHFERSDDVIKEIRRILKPGGRLYIWHTVSRDRVNEIHRQADGVISSDILIPADELADLCQSFGLSPVFVRDNEEEYLIITERL